MIRLEDLTIGFSHKTLLRNVSGIFPGKRLTGLIGRNGTGKSTLMKTICGLNEKYQGDILINRENIKRIPRNKLARLIAYVNTQRPRISNLKCKDIVALGRSPYTGWHGSLTKEDLFVMDKALRLVGMEEYKERNFNSLSDGECQKIMIARAIAQDTDIIILDEPTSFLDLPTRYDLAKLLKRLTEDESKTILFSTHELDIALKFCDYIAMIEGGNLYIGTSQDMRNNERLNKAFPNVF